VRSRLLLAGERLLSWRVERLRAARLCSMSDGFIVMRDPEGNEFCLD
jgi:hypothetical protein